MANRTRRTRRNIQTVDILKDTYRRLQIEAWNKHYNTKEYINEVLQMLLEKRDFLDKIAPNLTVVGYQENSVSLLDNKKKEVFEVFLRDLRLWCEKEKTTDCMHTAYVWAIPEAGKLFGSKKTETGKGANKKEEKHIPKRGKAIELMV